ncbi:helix-turn-helix transcriptional regulator [Salmonella enterica]|nr:XRE family transcriptional regulator [Salmonella enterica]EGY4498427.1 helix-turn-helix transcriptional regulator [Salmonella enterica]EHK4290944.1 helix-turn-helix transcriptional regulator [Salmonella enterica]EHK4305626.1 helix-turn-helix transcriptional regulator [Salmonella enterica]
MSSELGEKLKAIRESEELSQAKFANLTGISISTIKKYEVGILEPGGITLIKITKHPQFKKYTTWLMSDETNEAAGQISPSLSPDGQKRILPSQTFRKTGTRRD